MWEATNSTVKQTKSDSTFSCQWQRHHMIRFTDHRFGFSNHGFRFTKHRESEKLCDVGQFKWLARTCKFVRNANNFNRNGCSSHESDSQTVNLAQCRLFNIKHFNHKPQCNRMVWCMNGLVWRMNGFVWRMNGLVWRMKELLRHMHVTWSQKVQCWKNIQ